MRRDLPPSMRDERVMRIAATRYRRLDDRLLAIMYAESDIRAAGLGALDEKHRRGPLGRFYRVKTRVFHEKAGHGVLYRLGVKLPNRAVIPPIDSSYPPSWRNPLIVGNPSVTTAVLPAIQLEITIYADPFDSRMVIARRLRVARRELREERARKEAVR